MWLNRTTAPAAAPITLAEAKSHLRVFHAAEDAYIEALIGVATDYVDGRGGALGRALITQSWEYRRDAFPWECPECFWGPIVLPFPPLQTVQSVKYIDGAGVLQTLDAAGYAVHTGAAEGEITTAYGATWPETRAEPGAVRIAYTCGYGAAASAIPAPIRHAMLLMIGHLYTVRQPMTGIEGAAATCEIPLTITALLDPYRLPAF
jgi:uncharacterized phiE125 gp8 family phage protein